MVFGGVWMVSGWCLDVSGWCVRVSGHVSIPSPMAKFCIRSLCSNVAFSSNALWCVENAYVWGCLYGVYGCLKGVWMVSKGVWQMSGGMDVIWIENSWISVIIFSYCFFSQWPPICVTCALRKIRLLNFAQQNWTNLNSKNCSEILGVTSFQIKLKFLKKWAKKRRRWKNPDFCFL